MSTTRRAFLGGAIGAGIASAVGVSALPAPATSGVFCLADLQRAVATLSTAKPYAPVLFMSEQTFASFQIAQRRWKEDGILRDWSPGESYRARLTAESLMAHERRRESMGKRGHVTADEIVTRVRAMEEAC